MKKAACLILLLSSVTYAQSTFKVPEFGDALKGTAPKSEKPYQGIFDNAPKRPQTQVTPQMSCIPPMTKLEIPKDRSFTLQVVPPPETGKMPVVNPGPFCAAK